MRVCACVACCMQIGRLLSSAYCSALLQAVTAATEDLQDMYCAQLSCIQEARPGKGEQARAP